MLVCFKNWLLIINTYSTTLRHITKNFFPINYLWIPYNQVCDLFSVIPSYILKCILILFSLKLKIHIIKYYSIILSFKLILPEFPIYFHIKLFAWNQLNNCILHKFSLLSVLLIVLKLNGRKSPCFNRFLLLL